MTTTNWNANLYDTSHRFVSHYGSSLIDLLSPKIGERILDLGCGTGDLAQELNEQGVDVVGVDSATSMIQKAREKHPTISFQVEDITKLPFNHEFDAVFSNAVLHWVTSPQQALENIYRSVKSGGRFVAEFGGVGNVNNLTTAMIHQVREAGYRFEEAQFPWYFPSIGTYTSLMEEVGFQVTYARLYERPTILAGESGLKKWITMFADRFFYDVPENKRAALITQIENRLKEEHYQDGNWMADYTRIQVIGVK